jgi:hypothetical protein
MSKLVTMIAAVIAALVLVRTAHAQPFNGYVAGNITYFEAESQFCVAAAGQNCTDTTYTDAEFNTQQPIREAKVFVYEYDPVADVDLNLVGTGSTDLNGQFYIYWSMTGHSVHNIRYKWRADHKDDRFDVRNTTGAPFIMTSNLWMATKLYTSASHPQWFADKYWYDGTPHNPSNIYAGAWRMWKSLQDSTSLQAGWNGVQIRYGFQPNDIGPCGGACPSACACPSGGTGFVHLTVAHPLENQARVQHEMGHIASRYLNGRSLVNDYCFPGTLQVVPPATVATCVGGTTDVGGGGWDLNGFSGEWMNAAFEEGLATFLGDRAIYGQTNPEPTTCGGTSFCSPTNTSLQVERSTGNGVVAACGNLGNTPNGGPIFLRRSAMIVDRYLRDVYDSSNDGNVCGGATCQWGTTFNDTQARLFTEVVQISARFQSGFSDHQSNEPWTDSTFNTIDDRDGFGVGDYVWVYQNAVGGPAIDTSAARQFNCVAF